MAAAGLGTARGLHARDADRRKPRRDRFQRGARASAALPAALVLSLARVSGDAGAHDRIASAAAPARLRFRMARARGAGVRALDSGTAGVGAAASAIRTRVA